MAEGPHIPKGAAMKITGHFNSTEFACKDGTAYPQADQREDTRLADLCVTLERIRQELGGRSVRIVSGYRSPKYNRRIGGARKSQHMAGRAADITVRGISARRVHACVLALYREGELPYLGGLGAYSRFTHIDVRPRKSNGGIARWGGTRTKS